MTQRHPFEWLNEKLLFKAFITFSILTVILTIALSLLGEPLKTDNAPLGIISFEFAGDVPTAGGIVNSWDGSKRIYAGLNLGLDYLYMVVYPCCIGLGCVLVAFGFAGRREFLATTGIILAWAQILAGIFDSVENYALVKVLLGSSRALWPQVALWSAVPKFAFVIAGITYTMIGAAAIKIPGKKASGIQE